MAKKEKVDLDGHFDSVSFESDCIRFNDCLEIYEPEANMEGLPVGAYVSQMCEYCSNRKVKNG